MSAALYVFRLFWPFLKELVLGGLTLKEGMKTQKKKVFLLFFVSGLILSLFLIIPKFIALSQEHIQLEKTVTQSNIERLESKIKELEKAIEKPPADSPLVMAKPDDPEIDTAPPVLVQPKVPKQKAPKKKPPEAPAPDPEGLNDRKKAYMEFFEKYED